MKAIILKKCLTATLLVLSMNGYAQQDDVDILSSRIVFSRLLCTQVDENVKDLCWAKELKTVEKESVHQYLSDSPDHLISLLLVREQGQVVMHTYLQVPNYVFRFPGLGSDATYFVDAETGIHYRARGTYDDRLWGTPIGVKAPEGTIVDFPIYFPNLPETTSEIYVYGMPLLKNGTKIHFASHVNEAANTITYKTPNIRIPRKVEKKIVISDDDTCDVYTDAHLVKPTIQDNVAMWLTEEKTYFGVALEMRKNLQDFYIPSDIYIIDEETQMAYNVQAVQGLPLDKKFYIEGVAGDWIAIVLEFAPIDPMNVTFVWMEDDTDIRFTPMMPKTRYHSNVFYTKLLNNKPLFEYFERKIVE